MSSLLRSLRRRIAQTSPLAALFTATVGLAGWLGYQALDAAASHRRTAEAVLRDYAEISASELASEARSELDDVLDEVFDPVVRRMRSRPGLAPGAVAREMDDAARDQGCDCPALRSPLLLFRVDSSGAVEVVPDTVGPETRRRLAGLVALERPRPGRDRTGLVTAPAGELHGEPVAVGFVLSEDEDGGADPTFGFVVSAAALDELFSEWYADERLLPRAIVGDQPNDSVLYVTVEDPAGTRMFASPVTYETDLAATAPIGPQYGNLVVRAAIRPDAASRLINGGLPNSRLPLLAALLLLTFGVGVAAFVQLRREEAFQRLREDFVSGVSHELRTPLAQIRMFAELQEGGKLVTDGDRQRAVSVVAREARRLSHLVDNILQFSRLRRTLGRGMPLDRIELGEAVTDGLDSVTALLEDGGMRLELAAEPELWVDANREAVTRVVVNLLDNAIKYGPAGQTVTVQLARANGAARLSVQDQGPGVPDRERGRIWAAYRRLDRDVRARVPGSGIGLSVVSELASVHGGRAWVEGAEGGGADFIVEFPLATEPGTRGPGIR